MDAALRGFYLNVPKSDVKLFQQLAKRWDGQCLTRMLFWINIFSLVLKTLNCRMRIY